MHTLEVDLLAGDRVLAFGHLQQGYWALARECFNKILAMEPQNANIWFWVGECNYRLKQWAAARMNFDQVIQNNARHGLALARRADCYMQEKNPERAILDLNEAIRLLSVAIGNSTDIQTQQQAKVNLSYAYSLRGQFGLQYGLENHAASCHCQILDDLSQAVQLDPLNADAFVALGTYHAEVKAWGEAIKAFSEAIKLKPDVVTLKFWRGMSCVEDKKYNNAVEDFSAYLQARPDQGFALNYRAHAYVGMGKWENAMADYQKAARLGLKPDALTYYGCARCLLELGQTERALTCADACLSMGGGMSLYAHALMARGRALFELGQYGESVAAMSESIRLLEEAGEDAIPATYYRNQGKALARANRLEEAILSLSKAIGRDAADADAYHWRGLCRMCVRRLQAALEDFDAAIAINQELAGFYAGRGLCLMHRGYLVQSIEDLTRALELDGQLAWAYWYRSKALMRQGDYWGALADVNSLLALPANKLSPLLEEVKMATIEKRCAFCQRQVSRRAN